MEILEILKHNSADLLPQDLALFRTELAVGSYPESYREECLTLMKQLEAWKKPDTPHPESKPPLSSVQVDAAALRPAQTNRQTISFAEQCRADLGAMRLSDRYRSLFRTYIKSHEAFDEAFVDANFSLFTEWEIEAIVSELPLSETFLEKFFSMLDKDKIARYQVFSEGFYQKHFAEFDAETVLKKGKNDWRKKENRTPQFAVFLRLKGVQY